MTNDEKAMSEEQLRGIMTKVAGALLPHELILFKAFLDDARNAAGKWRLWHQDADMRAHGFEAQLAEKDAEHAAEMEKDWVVFTKHLAEKDAEIARLKEAGTPYWKERDLMNSYVLRVSDLEPQLAALTEALEHLAKQQTPEEYEEAENAELDADTGLEAYERMVLAARAALETARTR